jgi:hypothetical protein
MDDELHFGMLGGSKDRDDVGDEIEKSDALPTGRRRRGATTELERFDLGNSDLGEYEGGERRRCGCG